MPAPDELRRLPLTPVDGFVLSRVDGQSCEEDIVLVTGLPAEQVRQSLERLASLSLVSLGDEGPTRTTSRTMKSPAAAAEDARTATSGTSSTSSTPSRSSTPVESGPRVAGAVAPTPPSPIATPLAGVVAGIDLAAEEQLRILDVFGRLDDLDHYALLGVPRTAEKKEIKRAYYERAALYHPDRYFRRNVGPLKPKLEAIFSRVTLAHDVLADKAQRAEYDTYLATVAHARDLEARVEEGERVVREAQAAASVEPPVPAPAPRSAPTPLSSPMPPSVPTRPPPPAPESPRAASAPAQGEVRRPSRPVVTVDPQARRDIFAKRLIGGRAPAPPPAPPPSTPAAPGPTADPEALKRHFDQKRADVARSQAQNHKSAGDAAMGAGDAIAAASAYKAALSFMPDDAELQRLYAKAEQTSAAALAATYRTQATYEEKSGRWGDAAISWSKLAEISPQDADVQEHAANAILNAKGNLHDAATAAQRAVTLEPQNPRFRKLLATIYLEAGLLKNARREIDAAEQLAPGDVTIAALAKRLAQATGK